VMGASLAFAGLGLAGCRWPQEKLAPYAYSPPGVNPGMAKRFATAMELGGVAAGLLVTSYDGRPIKVEGNPTHPVNQGAASAMQQASLLEMYDPDRSQYPVLRQGGPKLNKSWDDFAAFATPHFEQLKATGGKGFAILSEATSSETVRGLRDRLLALMPQARWYEYEPISWDNEREGTRLAFGQPLRAHYDLSKAECIVSLGCDLLQMHPDALKHTRDFAAWRRAENGAMNRLYVVESSLSLTGAAADHRWALKPSEIPIFVKSLAVELFQNINDTHPHGGTVLEAIDWWTPYVKPPKEQIAEPYSHFNSIVTDMATHAGKCVIAAGPRQPVAVHALAHAMNLALGNVGQTVRYTAAPDPSRATHDVEVAELSKKLDAGEVQTLLILGGNPVYNAPGDAQVAVDKAKVSIHLGLHDDETSRKCTWHLPRAHYLESWGDARAWDGTLSIVQPLIEPLYGGKTPAEVLALCCGEAQAKGYDLVRSALKPLLPGDFEAKWTQALSDGIVPGTAWPGVQPSLAQADWSRELGFMTETAGLQSAKLELELQPDLKLYDGRFANNGWLQELPEPLSKITWDNALLIGVDDAKALGLKANDMVSIVGDSIQVSALEAPVYIMPGQAAGSVALALGYGRTASGRVGNKVGTNVYSLAPAVAANQVAGQPNLRYVRVDIKPTGKRHTLAVTQDHWVIDAVGFKEQQRRIGPLVREGTLDEYKANPKFAQEMLEVPPLISPWKEHEYNGHRWGMAIDLSSCTGCGACVTACQAENNIPVVGRKQVAVGREMHWIRIDRYFTGDPAAPDVRHQPLACHHCELAPCESVCPVAATVHSAEGLNEMVYNRCVGTRYCSNNCPYKVRRFNFFNYRKHMAETEKLAMNPEVTVRSRGVMEKCTFCVQRIEAVKITAKNEQRPIADLEIVPACAQTCPAQAIIFGDLNDPNSRARKLHDDDRAYQMLAELNVKPRTSYLAKLRNPAAGVSSETPAAAGNGAKGEGR
jgi:Fe-S-cluster-containing dehydrogenase component/anaerobic selenocysteine-containing dehydrogenase